MLDREKPVLAQFRFYSNVLFVSKAIISVVSRTRIGYYLQDLIVGYLISSIIIPHNTASDNDIIISFPISPKFNMKFLFLIVVSRNQFWLICFVYSL